MQVSRANILKTIVMLHNPNFIYKQLIGISGPNPTTFVLTVTHKENIK